MIDFELQGIRNYVMSQKAHINVLKDIIQNKNKKIMLLEDEIDRLTKELQTIKEGKK